MRPAGRLRGRGSSITRSLAGPLLLLLPFGAAIASRAAADLPPGVGLLLPVQDRVGRPPLTELVEQTLEGALAAHATLAAPEEVRPVLRALRMRDASDEPPGRLAALADRLGADWFFLVTLHEARTGRLPRRDDSGLGRTLVDEGTGDTPQIALSAKIIERGSNELWWAGFRAASGRDREGLFGRGEVELLDELAREVARELVAKAVRPPAERLRPRLRHRRHGFLRISDSAAVRVAVIPMDSVAELEAGAAAEVATAALFAALTDYGFRTLLPGLVRTIRQESGRPFPGGAARAEWEALEREAGAAWVATGTVETYRRGFGRDPRPWVAFSVRLLDTADGSIDALAGLERTGPDTGSAFDRGRIYSSAELAYEMMRALVYGMRPSPGSTRAQVGG